MSKKLIKRIIAIALKVISVVYAFYIGVWMMGIHNCINTIQHLMAGDLSVTSFQFVKNVIAFVLSLSVAGAIWCVGDILSNKFKDKPQD